MRDDLWETIDWGDDDDTSGEHHHLAQATAMSPPTLFDRRETAEMARLSGLSAGSESENPPDRSSTTNTSPERRQHSRNKRVSWFDFDADLTKLVPLEDEEGGYSSCRSRSQRRDSTTGVEHETKRRLRRRQSDYALEKRRVLETHALEEHPTSRSFTKRLLSSVGLGKNGEATTCSVSVDEELDVPFPTYNRRQSCSI